MNHFIKGGSLFLAVALLAGCARVATLDSAGAKVKVSHQLPPRSCHFLGKLTAKQSAQLVPGKELETGAMNLLRNLAARRGANYVHIEENYANYFRGGYMSDAISLVVIEGAAYRCPKLS